MLYFTHHALVSVITSIDDGAVVVEDYSALVQSGHCVEEVEGPQIPLKLKLRTMTLFFICINLICYTFNNTAIKTTP